MVFDKEQLNDYFVSEEMIIYTSHSDEDRSYYSAPYGGRLDTNGYDEWSFAGLAHPAWCGYYENKGDLDWIADAISEDGSSLIIRVGDYTSVASIGTMGIYRTENILVYYDGDNSEVYTILEELYGRPIADGSLTENSSS